MALCSACRTSGHVAHVGRSAVIPRTHENQNRPPDMGAWVSCVLSVVGMCWLLRSSRARSFSVCRDAALCECEVECLTRCPLPPPSATSACLSRGSALSFRWCAFGCGSRHSLCARLSVSGLAPGLSSRRPPPLAFLPPVRPPRGFRASVTPGVSCLVLRGVSYVTQFRQHAYINIDDCKLTEQVHVSSFVPLPHYSRGVVGEAARVFT